jgi:4-amino-4-deoxy-L-arabinose transferase-like glycosyltransferase
MLALVAYVLAGTPLVPFHGDESTQIFMSRDYAYEFIQHDLSKILFSENPAGPTEQQLRLINGTVNKYLIGLAWHTGGFSLSDINEQWDWGADWNYNQQNSHAPSDALLQAARWPSAILLAAGVAVIFTVGNMLGGKPAAYAASLYYALNPALLLNGRRAMMEGSFIFFSLLVLLAGVWLVSRPSLPRAILLGLAAGLALASKHTAVFTVGAVFLAALVYLLYQSIRAQDDTSVVEYLILPYLIIAAIVTGAVFYVLNPAWWGAPLDRARLVLNLRTDLLNTQTQVFGHYIDLSDQLGGFLRQSLLAQPQYYEVSGWGNFIGDQIARYEASGLRGVSVGGTMAGAAALCVIITLGLWRLIRNPSPPDTVLLPAAWRKGDVSSTGVRWLVGVWLGTMTVITALLTPLEWQRYYLPVYPVVGLLAGLGVGWGIRFLTGRVRRLRHVPKEKEIQLDRHDGVG